ncbi:MAG: hypothetical protein J6A54_02910 [Clostridia bacterium]|nr:hypothetical protein [Clostridia bacterium]
MDSKNSKVKQENDFDIRDVANYLLGKLWIIILAVVCFAVSAIIVTSIETPKYTSKSSIFIINAQDNTVSSQQMVSDWTVGKQLAVTSPKLVTKAFCEEVVANLNADPEHPNNISLSDFYGDLKVESDEETCIVTFYVTTYDPARSELIANELANSFGAHIEEFMATDTIRTKQVDFAEQSSRPSNIHTTRNALLAGLVGAILACAVLVVIFMFDDKIKTPDDIDRYLELSVLGVIPEIDTEA